jgi:tetratricopeptide (TPR) repeat protein
LLLGALVLPAPAHADRDKAKAEYAEAVRRYDLNEFRAALLHFKQAYLEYEEPSFLFNIAQCHRQLGDKQQAVLFYRSYLRKVPDAPNADEVHRLISSLEAASAQEQVSAPPPTVTSAPPATATANAQLVKTAPAKKALVYKKWWLWTTVGLVAAGGAVALGLTLGSRGEPTLSTVRAMP